VKKISRRLLQISIAIGGIVPVGGGLGGIIMGTYIVTDNPAPDAIDSHFRYLSGLLLGIGLSFWYMIPTIEKQGARFQLLALIVFIGGLGRLWSLWTLGTPAPNMLFGLGMELVVMPLLAFWQYAISKA